MQEKKQKFYCCEEYENKKKQLVLAISGVKNSGKTTLITKLLPFLKKRGLKTAVMKHDGHEFEADIPNTDTWKFAKAGADGTLVFSKTKYMLVHYDKVLPEEKLISNFPEADVILLEGFKHSSYPKLEIIRKGNSKKSVCEGNSLLGIVTDFRKEELNVQNVTFFDLNQAEILAEWIYQLWKKMEEKKE